MPPQFVTRSVGGGSGGGSFLGGAGQALGALLIGAASGYTQKILQQQQQQQAVALKGTSDVATQQAEQGLLHTLDPGVQKSFEKTLGKDLYGALLSRSQTMGAMGEVFKAISSRVTGGQPLRPPQTAGPAPGPGGVSPEVAAATVAQPTAAAPVAPGPAPGAAPGAAQAPVLERFHALAPTELATLAGPPLGQLRLGERQLLDKTSSDLKGQTIDFLTTAAQADPVNYASYLQKASTLGVGLKQADIALSQNIATNQAFMTAYLQSMREDPDPIRASTHAAALATQTLAGTGDTAEIRRLQEAMQDPVYAASAIGLAKAQAQTRHELGPSFNQLQGKYAEWGALKSRLEARSKRVGEAEFELGTGFDLSQAGKHMHEERVRREVELASERQREVGGIEVSQKLVSDRLEAAQQGRLYDKTGLPIPSDRVTGTNAIPIPDQIVLGIVDARDYRNVTTIGDTMGSLRDDLKSLYEPGGPLSLVREGVAHRLATSAMAVYVRTAQSSPEYNRVVRQLTNIAMQAGARAAGETGGRFTDKDRVYYKEAGPSLTGVIDTPEVAFRLFDDMIAHTWRVKSELLANPYHLPTDLPRPLSRHGAEQEVQEVIQRMRQNPDPRVTANSTRDYLKRRGYNDAFITEQVDRLLPKKR